MAQEESNGASGIDVLKAIREGETIKLSTGVMVRMKSIPPIIMQDISQKLERPEPPMVEVEVDVNGQKQKRVEANPSDPKYERSLVEHQRRLNSLALEAMVILGIELVDGVPPADEWLPRLQYLEKRGMADLSRYDLDDPQDLEVVYKNYVAVGASDIVMLSEAQGVTEAKIGRAAENFSGS